MPETPRQIDDVYPIGYTVIMNPIRTLRDRATLTQQALAEAGGTSQPAIAAYEAGRKSPTVETLQRLAGAVGLQATVHYTTPLTREDRRSLALHRSIATRLAADPETVLAQARANLGRMVAGAGQLPALREWALILERPLPALLPVLTDEGEWSRELRHQTPFAGVLGAAERAAVYQAFEDEERGGT